MYVGNRAGIGADGQESSRPLITAAWISTLTNLLLAVRGPG